MTEQVPARLTVEPPANLRRGGDRASSWAQKKTLPALVGRAFCREVGQLPQGGPVTPENAVFLFDCTKNGLLGVRFQTNRTSRVDAAFRAFAPSRHNNVHQRARSLAGRAHALSSRSGRR